MAKILEEGPIRKMLREKRMRKSSPEEYGVAKAFFGERFPGREEILVIRPLPPLSTSLDLDGLHIVELQSADGRIIAVYRRV